MSIIGRLQQIIQSLVDAAGKIFGPDEDDYPATGSQPWKGDVYDERRDRRSRKRSYR